MVHTFMQARNEMNRGNNRKPHLRNDSNVVNYSPVFLITVKYQYYFFPQDGNTPTITSSLSCGDPCTLANGAVGRLNVTVVVPSSSTFSNIRFDVTSQLVADVERVGLCDARISSAAAELGCLPYTTETIDATKTST